MFSIGGARLLREWAPSLQSIQDLTSNLFLRISPTLMIPEIGSRQMSMCQTASGPRYLLFRAHTFVDTKRASTVKNLLSPRIVDCYRWLRYPAAQRGDSL